MQNVGVRLRNPAKSNPYIILTAWSGNAGKAFFLIKLTHFGRVGRETGQGYVWRRRNLDEHGQARHGEAGQAKARQKMTIIFTFHRQFTTATVNFKLIVGVTKDN